MFKNKLNFITEGSRPFCRGNREISRLPLRRHIECLARFTHTHTHTHTHTRGGHVVQCWGVCFVVGGWGPRLKMKIVKRGAHLKSTVSN